MSKRIQDEESQLTLQLEKKRRVPSSDEVAYPGQTVPRLGVSHRPRSRTDYNVGWICALPLEMTAAKAMLDEAHPDIPNLSNDNNAYTLDSIGGHNIVIACLSLGVYGTTSAATVASQMLSSFQSIKVRLMTGIGGGVPSQKVDGDRKFVTRNGSIEFAKLENMKGIMETLLAADQIDPDYRDDELRTPLFKAFDSPFDLVSRHEEVVTLLLETEQVDPEAADYLGHTPLSRARERGLDSLVRMMESALNRRAVFSVPTNV